jgi:hypothetical protein
MSVVNVLSYFVMPGSPVVSGQDAPCFCRQAGSFVVLAGELLDGFQGIELPDGDELDLLVPAAS